MTNHTPRQVVNRTGAMASPDLGAEMIAATREFPPSSAGTARAVADVRVAHAEQREALPDAPAQPDMEGQAIASEVAASRRLVDKLGERLAFEQAGTRLYEALMAKHQAYGDFAGGPSAEDLMRILSEEYEHGEILREVIEGLGGDPTALTSSANLAVNASAGLPQVLTDPRTNLLECLEAIVVAELADNEGWSVLEALARQARLDQLGMRCHEAIRHERDHLRKVRAWIAAGHGLAPGDAIGAEWPGPTDPGGSDAEEEKLTFTATSPVDGEGYAVSEARVAEIEQSKPGKSSRRPSRRSARSSRR